MHVPSRKRHPFLYRHKASPRGVAVGAQISPEPSKGKLPENRAVVAEPACPFQPEATAEAARRGSEVDLSLPRVGYLRLQGHFRPAEAKLRHSGGKKFEATSGRIT